MPLVIMFEDIESFVNTINIIDDACRVVTTIEERVEMIDTLFNLIENYMDLFENHKDIASLHHMQVHNYHRN